MRVILLPSKKKQTKKKPAFLYYWRVQCN